MSRIAHLLQLPARSIHKSMKWVKVWVRSLLQQAGVPAAGKAGSLSKWIVRCCMVAFIFLALTNRLALAQQPQPLQSFGYVGISDYLQSHPGQPVAADWDFFGTDPPPSTPDAIIDITGRLALLQNNIGVLGQPHPVKAYIDVSQVFWRPDPLPPADPTHFVFRADYVDRWIQFKNAQGVYFQPDQIGRYVFAFNVFNEPRVWDGHMSDIQKVAALLKCPVTPSPTDPNPDCQRTGGFPFIPTTIIEFGGQVADPAYVNFPLADYVDWYGIDLFGVHPDSSGAKVQDAMDRYRSMMAPLAHSQQKVFYTIDGFYDTGLHPCLVRDDMPGIAQEWFNVASRDQTAITTGVFLLPDLLDSKHNRIGEGSASLGPDVLEKQAHIWQSIHDAKGPAYEGNLENSNCRTISGWAWDSNQSDNSLLGTTGYNGNPAYLDYFVDGIFFNYLPARDPRPDIGKGTGFHGFTIPTPDYAKDGGLHTINVRYSGTKTDLPGSPHSFSCAPPSFLLASGLLGQFYSQSVWNGGTPSNYNFDLVGGQLPPGLMVDSSGTLVGVPTTSGSFAFTVKATGKRRAVLHPPSGCTTIPTLLNTSTNSFSVTIQCGGSACSSQLEGYNDGSNGDNIWGWAWDKSQPSGQIQVDIYESSADVVPDGTPLLARVNANLFRQDLLDAGKGDGNHAFVFPVPESLKDGNTHRIHATFAGTKTELSWSPRTIVASSARFVGVHSSNDCNRIDGFAVDNWQPNTPIDVNIFDSGVLLASMVANYDSLTVPATGGNGTHGFLYYTPDRLKDGNTHQITVTFKSSGQQLSSTNRLLSCPAVPPPSSPSWEGWFDNVTCDRVDGWAWDANRPNSPVDIGLFADGARVATLTANYFGQDLLDAHKGNGVHRYLYYLPDFLKDGVTHHITAQIVGPNTDLPISSPITNGSISCAAMPQPGPPPPHAIANTSIGGGSTASSGSAIGFTPAVNVTFSSVSNAGFTSFTPINPVNLPLLPDGYSYAHATINPSAFDISTTAGYSGAISIAFTVLSENDPSEFSLLRVLHLEGGGWVDRTSFASMSTHQVAASVGSLSPFVIARLSQGPISSNVGISSRGSSVYGQSVTFTAQVSGLGIDIVPGGTATFRDGAQDLGTVLIDRSAQATLTTSLLSAGSHNITVIYNGDPIFPSSFAQMVQVVSPASLLVSAANASRQYGTANPLLSGAISGLQNNDNITAVFDSTAAPTSSIGTYSITSTLSDPDGKLGNYTVAAQNGVLTVTAAPLTVTANNASRFYGDVNPAFTGTISGLLNGDNITASYQSSATAGSIVGTYAITIILSDPGGSLGNYSVSQNAGSLTVQAAPLQIVANNKTKMYGDPIPVLDGTITGVRNGDTNIQAQYSITANSQSLVGTYPITATLFDPNGRSGNYSVTIQNGTLTVTRSAVALANPVLSPSGGTSSPGQTVTLTEPTSSAAAIHYTVDGTTPTAASPLYTGPILLNAGSTTLKAMATQPEYTDSAVSSGGYFIRIPVSTTPASQTILGCANGNYTISIPAVSALSGSSIALSISGLPTGATAGFSPPSIGSPGSSTLTVTPSSSTPPVNYSLIITATTGSYTGTSTVTLVVQDFTASVTSPSQAVTAGGSASYGVSTTANNSFAGSVALSMSGLPAGASATFSPVSITGSGASTLIITTSTSTPVGTYSLTLAASSGCRVRTLPLTLVVNAPPPSGPNITSLSPVAGPVGTAVTITGSNFGATQGSSTVTFNGTAATATAWNAGSISTSVPLGAKTGNVVVTAGGTASNGVSFTVQDDAVHIFGTNCSTCGWQVTDFTIQASPLYGYTIRSGDILYFYQWQNTSSVAGIEVCFPSGEGVACADNGLTVDQDNKPVHADTITGVTHFRRVDLSPNAGQTLSQISFHSHGTTKAGRWDVYFSNVQIVSADGSVRSIFVTGSAPSLFKSSSFGVTGTGSAIEHNHVW